MSILYSFIRIKMLREDFRKLIIFFLKSIAIQEKFRIFVVQLRSNDH